MYMKYFSDRHFELWASLLTRTPMAPTAATCHFLAIFVCVSSRWDALWSGRRCRISVFASVFAWCEFFAVQNAFLRAGGRGLSVVCDVPLESMKICVLAPKIVSRIASRVACTNANQMLADNSLFQRQGMHSWMQVSGSSGMLTLGRSHFFGHVCSPPVQSWTVVALLRFFAGWHTTMALQNVFTTAQ